MNLRLEACSPPRSAAKPLPPKYFCPSPRATLAGRGRSPWRQYQDAPPSSMNEQAENVRQDRKSRQDASGRYYRCGKRRPLTPTLSPSDGARENGQPPGTSKLRTCGEIERADRTHLDGTTATGKDGPSPQPSPHRMGRGRTANPMNEQAESLPRDRSSARAHFVSKLSRYQNLLRKKWWIPVVGIGLGLGTEAVLSRFQTASYMSVGRMIVSIKLAIPEGSVYTEELSNFLGTQAALMQSGVVINRAHSRVMGQKPDRPMRPTALKVSVLPKTTIFVLQGTGDDPQYTQAFLQACMEEYVQLKKEMRMQTSDTTVAGLTEEVLRLEKELRKSDQELVEFQSTNSVVLLQEQGNSAGNQLAA